MAEELNYKRLRDLVREEKAQPGLAALPQDFYVSVEGFLSSKFSEMESNRSVLQMREFENAIAVIREISSMRQQKILFKAIRNGGHKGTEGMTREEHELYDRFCAVLEDERGRLESVVSAYERRRQADAGPKAEGGKVKKVRFVKDVPAYKGANNETFGPFKPGDESALPCEEAEWLLKGKLAEAVG